MAKSAVTPKGDGGAGKAPRETTPGGSRRRPGGVGWSGPAPDAAGLAARGAAKRKLYFSPERNDRYLALCRALGLEPEAIGSLAAVWDRAAAALARELGEATADKTKPPRR